MTRGRRKDLTIPPSRALLQQRDYRARKARYVAELEDRCQRLEQDNSQLREQVDMLQAKLCSAGNSSGLPPSANSEVVRTSSFSRTPSSSDPFAHRHLQIAASSELMHQLTGAATSLARFQQVAFSNGSFGTTAAAPPPQMMPHSPIPLATPSFTPSPVPFPSRRLPSPRPGPRLEHATFTSPLRHDTHREPYTSTSTYPHRAPPMRTMDSPPATSVYSESSECCDGYVDCRGLVEEDHDGQSDEEDSPQSTPIMQHFAPRTSDMRSTSEEDSAMPRAGRSR
ncbi:hypothetical protein BKA93DRAFT_820461 [Sparassis latifolia]